jgi:hydrogenase expression/formation protein HypE
MEKIVLSHGSGGMLSRKLVKDVFLQEFKDEILKELNDSAVFNGFQGRLAYTTDSYVIDPIFFPGGDIGRLSVCGTVNDLSMVGARPAFLSASFIIEEGFLIDDLRLIVKSMKIASNEACIRIVCGDIKVVPKGSADKIFITTSGIGFVPNGINVSPKRIRPTDKVILSGFIGDHGIAIMSVREGLSFQTEIRSDVSPLNRLVESMIKIAPKDIHALRDPTRGGLAATLNEFVEDSNFGIKIYENRVPIREEVRSACELLGLDPFYVANEGKLIAIVSNESAEEVLAVIRKHPYGKDAQIIGEVVEAHSGVVSVQTQIGGSRILSTPAGEQLPRIC